jgi:hypothetical protein
MQVSLLQAKILVNFGEGIGELGRVFAIGANKNELVQVSVSRTISQTRARPKPMRRTRGDCG